jgi:hypothetical protein
MGDILIALRVCCAAFKQSNLEPPTEFNICLGVLGSFVGKSGRVIACHRWVVAGKLCAFSHAVELVNRDLPANRHDPAGEVITIDQSPRSLLTSRSRPSPLN